MNRDQYETYMIVAGFLSWLLIAGLLALFWLLGPRNARDVMIKFFRRFDLAPRRHAAEARHEDHAEVSHAPSALGGVVSIGLFLLGLITTSLLCFNYSTQNTMVLSSLDVYNTSFVKTVAIDMDINVGFVGYSGCTDQGSKFYPATLGETTVPTVVASGVTYASRSDSYQCTDGVLNMNLRLSRLKVATSPSFSFAVESACAPCKNTATINPVNKKPVQTCPACSVSSAQAITYSIKASNNFPMVKGLHGRDANFVNGSVVPTSPDEAFRGEVPTEAKVMLMPSDYDNRRTAKKFHSYRLLYADTKVGSTQGFAGAIDATTNTEFFGQRSAPTDYKAWVKNEEWAAAGAVNAVRFTLAMPLAQNRVRILIDNNQSFLDLWGAVGGVLWLLITIFFLAMSYVERTNDPNDPVGALYKTYAGWLADYKLRLRDQWYPEPESWTMENISRMQRKEEKREGGARTNEDAAVTNFKDLYSRNAIAATAAKARDEQDYGSEVDDYHGQL